MTTRLILTALLLAPLSVAAKAPPIETACAARSLGAPSECACLQALADDTVRAGLHDLIADYLGRRVDVAAIAAERGHSGAEALYDAHAGFRSEAGAACGVSLPEE